jgi:hypothetical protein
MIHAVVVGYAWPYDFEFNAAVWRISLRVSTLRSNQPRGDMK